MCPVTCWIKPDKEQRKGRNGKKKQGKGREGGKGVHICGFLLDRNHIISTNFDWHDKEQNQCLMIAYFRFTN